MGRNIMSNINPEEVHNDIDRAIERQEYSAGSESICEILQPIAGETLEYWYEAACELHRREKFYEAFNCWEKAEKLIE